jgi:hypothetical protein
MYFCYLDESGVVELGASTDHFVLLGFAVPAATWKQKDAEVNSLKAKYGLRDKEVHTAWMARDYPEQKVVPSFESLNWDERRKAVLGTRALNLARATRTSNKALLKNYRKTEAYVHLTRAERVACLTELAKMVGGWNDVRIFADAHSKQHLNDVDHFRIAFEQVVTRFNTYLTIAATDHLGLLVQDNNQTVARRLTDVMRMYHRQGTLWSKIDRIVETPLFVDSELTSMVQLSDLCAYAVRRYFEKGETHLFSLIRNRFDRNKGKLVGLRHFTGKADCQCDVCVDHGRN